MSANAVPSKTERDYPDVATSDKSLAHDDLWTRKIRTLFRRLDQNGRGFLRMDNCLEVASTLIAEFPKMRPMDEDRLVKESIDFWLSVLSRHLPRNERVNGLVNDVDFVKNFRQVINGEFRDKFAALMVEPYFQAVDMDQDGKITQAEFCSLMAAWKSPPTEAQTMFRALDTSKSGKITQKDFHCALAMYFFSSDPGFQPDSQFQRMWGTLVSYRRPDEFPQCGCGPVWETKVRNMFRRLDVGASGKLQCDDFIEIGRCLASNNRLSKGRTLALMKAMLDIWVKLFGMDKEGQIFEEIKEEQFVQNLRDRINSDFRHEIDQLGWSFFKAVEIGGLGHISIAEYCSLQKAWKVSSEDAENMFKSIDSDHDGKISCDEYLNAWCDYFFSEDPNSAYKNFFGPAIERNCNSK